MPARTWLDDIPFPFDHARQLTQAMRSVRQLRLGHPDHLFHWEPELPLNGSERPRRELALAISLVQALDTGDGGYEARIKACQKLYKLGNSAPGEAIRAGELLLRSRVVSGATDMETFWLAVTVAHAARAMVSPAVADLAWRYLTQAPFDLDVLSAIDFAKISRKHRHSDRPRWPWELTSAMLPNVGSRELGITVLEAMAAVHLRAGSIQAAATKLPAKKRLLTPLFQDVIIRLAGLYVDGELDTLYAREVARQAAALGDKRAKAFIEARIFDVPYDELGRMVKAWIKGEEGELDDYYRQALEEGQLHVARRLAEVELVLRYGAWKKGPVYPSLESVISDLLSRPDEIDDPRLKELMLRTGLLYSRTHHYTPAAHRLVEHLTTAPAFTEDSPIDTMADELNAFIRACDPYNTLQEATARMEARLKALKGDAREVLEESRGWMADRFKIGGRMVSRAATTVSDPWYGRKDLGNAPPLAALLHKGIGAAHRLGPSLINVPLTKAEIATQAGMPWRLILEANPRRLKTTALNMARVDRLTAAGAGAATGLMGGPWGAAIDLFTLVGLSARAVGRVGLCFGISPGTPEALRLLTGSLLVASSTSSGEGLVALLREEAHDHQTDLIASGAIMTAAAGPRLQPKATSALISRVARLMGLSLSERQLIRMMPLVGAVFSAGADYLFLRAVSEAAVNLAARGFLMTDAGLVSRP